jgi:hypothetical protein
MDLKAITLDGLRRNRPDLIETVVLERIRELEAERKRLAAKAQELRLLVAMHERKDVSDDRLN